MSAQVEISEKRVLVIGGTGKFGGLVSQALLDRGAKVRLLVRPGSETKVPTELAKLAEVHRGNAGAFDDVHTVVSAVQGGPDTIIDAQLEYLRAARDAGVRRFIPSDYSFNLFGLGEGENINSDWRRTFARRADMERESVEVVHVMIGCFLDVGVLYGFIGGFDLKKGEAYLWGSGEHRMQFTTYRDAARYVTEAALASEALPREFFVAGDSLDFQELVNETAAGLDQTIAIRSMGSLSDLDSEIDRRRALEPNNLLAWLPLMYWRGMLNGKGELGPLQNTRFPAINPMSVRQYAQSIAGTA